MYTKLYKRNTYIKRYIYYTILKKITEFRQEGEGPLREEVDKLKLVKQDCQSLDE